MAGVQILLHPAFWVAALLGHLLARSTLPVARVLSFGLFNAAVLLMLLGWRPVLLAGAISTALWCVLVMTSAERGEPAARPRVGLAAVLALSGAFAAYKLAHRGEGSLPLLPEMVAQFSGNFWGAGLAALSFSYVYLRVLDAIAAVASGRARLLDPLSLFGYLVPFHMLASGPIAAYREHVTMPAGATPPMRWPEWIDEIDDVTTGLLYKFAIAEGMRTYMYGAGAALPVPGSLAETMFLLVYVFFDFAGYSRIALAVGRLCGVPTPRNFRAPFLATSVTDFWSRWHMSLGAFVLRNIYLPLQLTLMRRSAGRSRLVSLFTLAISFAFVGLWHRFTITFLLWGAAMGMIMFLEKSARDYCLRFEFARSAHAETALRIVGPVYVFLVISVSLRWVMGEMVAG